MVIIQMNKMQLILFLGLKKVQLTLNENTALMFFRIKSHLKKSFEKHEYSIAVKGKSTKRIVKQQKVEMLTLPCELFRDKYVLLAYASNLNLNLSKLGFSASSKM